MYHSHYYAGLSSIDDGHRHEYNGRTTPAPSGIPHTHYIIGYTSYDDGHTHYYMIQTSVDYPVPGGHIHNISGVTQITEQHYHALQTRTTSAY
ncbi:hypothetical protein CPJCM30710_15160 [Clostridium polyendosporum]|uniref:YmaF family protein n=1 Tax=Clostridium polyendosporum TaxID=69208 RepID=A0A919RYG9_9CLOT|nr:YmaF family protein [Clostridium polyendosporum]GIM28850.1 hypothetical protein CPJCM30710_15160 [Clostridium polyendosporum]